MVEKDKKKTGTGRLPGMPPKTQLEKDTEAVIDAWEVLQGKKADLFEAKVKLMTSMKSAHRTKVEGLDSKDIKRKIEHKEHEGLIVSKGDSDD